MKSQTMAELQRIMDRMSQLEAAAQAARAEAAQARQEAAKAVAAKQAAAAVVEILSTLPTRGSNRDGKGGNKKDRPTTDRPTGETFLTSVAKKRSSRCEAAGQRTTSWTCKPNVVIQ